VSTVAELTELVVAPARHGAAGAHDAAVNEPGRDAAGHHAGAAAGYDARPGAVPAARRCSVAELCEQVRAPAPCAAIREHRTAVLGAGRERHRVGQRAD